MLVLDVCVTHFIAKMDLLREFVDPNIYFESLEIYVNWRDKFED